MEQNQYYYLKVDRKRNDEIVKFILLLLQHQNEVAGYYFALRVTKKNMCVRLLERNITVTNTIASNTEDACNVNVTPRKETMTNALYRKLYATYTTPAQNLHKTQT